MCIFTTIPNILTLLRIALTPFICFVLSFRTDLAYTVAFYLFVVSSVTDFADGYIARKIGARSSLGAILDPLADKIFIVLILFFLAGIGRISLSALWPCVLIIGREMVVMGLRNAFNQDSFPVTLWAKGKTFLQMISTGLIVLPYVPYANWVIPFFLWLTAVLGLYSGWLYIKQAVTLYDRHID